MKTAAVIVAMFTFTVIANLMLKMGAVMGREAGGSWWVQLLNWRVVAGFASFGAAALFYTILLRTVALNVAQSFTAAQYIAVILASALVLAEPITATRWLGIALIACGILIVGWSQP
jgi:drug/metabolite transporter (DMT)-like permease